jgi:hypothetical protein
MALKSHGSVEVKAIFMPPQKPSWLKFLTLRKHCILKAYSDGCRTSFDKTRVLKILMGYKIFAEPACGP